MNNNQHSGFNSFQPQPQPQPEPMYQNYSLPMMMNNPVPSSNFGFDNMAFQPFINQQQQPPVNTQVILFKIFFISFPLNRNHFLFLKSNLEVLILVSLVPYGTPTQTT